MHIGVMGAGSIGTYVGGRLAAAGTKVTLVGRARLLDPIAAHGLVLEDLEGAPVRLAATQLSLSQDAAALADCDVVLLTTKSIGTTDAARALASVLSPRAVVVSLQNGVDNPHLARAELGAVRVAGGMISFNVVRTDAEGSAPVLRRTTTGPIAIEDRPESAAVTTALIAALRRAGLDARPRRDIDAVLWSKLLFNLNNAINALSGLPLREQLQQRAFRRVMAGAMREGLEAMRADGLRPVSLGTLSPALAVRVLPLPDVIFRNVARAMIRIDPKARGSMADDLELGRLTEIDQLNGAVVRLGDKHGVPTPINARIVERIREAERRGAGLPRVAAQDLL